MEQVVEKLIEARHKAGLSLEDLQERTLIPVRQLAMLEAKQFDKIGPSVYLKGFLRRYAQEVGIDPDSLWRIESSQLPLAAPLGPKKRAKPLGDYILPFLRIGVFLAILLLVGILIYKAFISDRDPNLPDPPAPPNQQEQPEPEPEPEPEPVVEEVKVFNLADWQDQIDALTKRITDLEMAVK